MSSHCVNGSGSNIKRLFHNVGKTSESRIKLVCNDNRVQGFCLAPRRSLGAG